MSAPEPTTPYPTSRRIVFHGLGALGVAAALAGCGSSNDGGTTPAADPTPGGATPESASRPGTVLTRTSEVPQNGGVILTDAKIVITQPSAGTYRAFTATCTHQGFLVTSVDGDTINCNHHGSEYNATDGSVKRGPAQASLTVVNVVVDGANLVTA